MNNEEELTEVMGKNNRRKELISPFQPQVNQSISLHTARSLIVLVGISLFVYWNVLGNGFVYDDIPAILKNPLITHPEQRLWDLQGLIHSWMYLLFQDNPLPYHLINILLHGSVVIGVFLFLQLFFGSRASFLGALVFAVHPIHTEAVSWITGGNYILLALYILSTYLLYRRATDVSLATGRIQLRWYIVSLILFFYFLMFGASFHFMTPVFLALSDVLLKRWRTTWKLWIPFFFILFIRIVLMRGLISGRIEAVAEEAGGAVSWVNPIPKFIYSMAIHSRLLVWPLHLTLYHHDPTQYSPVFMAVGIVCALAVIAAIPVLLKKAREIVLAAGIFVLFLAPTYSPITIGSLIGERYLYFPSIALSIIIAFLYQRSLSKNKTVQKVFIGLFIIMILAFSIRTILRNSDWKTSAILWRRTLIASPLSPWAHRNMGFVYQQEGDFQNALAEYEKAIQLKPNLWDAYNNLGTVYESMGEKEEAIRIYKQLIENNPRFVKSYNNLAVLYNNMGKRQDAVAMYKKAIAVNPDYAYAYYNLGALYQEEGREEEAQQMYRTALALDPSLKNIYAAQHMQVSVDYYRMGLEYSMRNQHREAIAAYQKALEQDSNNPSLYINLGNAYGANGDVKEAIATYEKALAIEPANAVAHYNLAVAYFDHKEYGAAIKHCDLAIQFGYQPPQDFLEQLKKYR